MSQNDKQNDVYDGESDSGFDESYNSSFDDGAAYTEDAADGEWANESDDSTGDVDMDGDGGSEPPSPKKKRSNLTVFLILFVAIIGVFGIMILKGGKKAPVDQAPIVAPIVADSNAVSQSAPLPAGNEPTVAALQQAQQQVQQQVQQQGGVMNNPDVLNQAAATNPNGVAPVSASQTAPSQQPVAPNQTASVTPAPTMVGNAPQPPGSAVTPEQTSAVTSIPAAPADTTLVKAMTPDVKPVSDFPKVDAIKKADTPQPTAVGVAKVDAAPSPSAPSPSALTAPSDAPIKVDAVTSGNDAQVKAIQSQLDAALEKVSKLEKDVSDREARLQEERQQSASSPSEVQALKEKIAALEEKLATKKVDKTDQGVSLENNQVAKKNASSSYHHAALKPVRKVYTSIPKKHVTSQPVTKAPKSVGWVLKSAKPGAAVIGSASTGDLKSVKIGDAVAGLGRVTSIRETSTGWVVQGTQGFLGE